MKFIHCADIHIGSALGTHLPPDRAAARRSELLHIFADIAVCAAENDAAGVLIAGDLFDTTRVTRRAADFVLDTVRAYPNIGFYCLRGNHDGSHRAFDGAAVPENLHFFSPSFAAYSLGNVRIGGLESPGTAADLAAVDFPEDTCNILLLHGGVGNEVGEDKVPLPLLRGKNIDYLALGHYHSFREGKLDDRGRWAYSGCPEGRGFDECGPKGVVLLDTQAHSLQFLPLARRQLRDIPADITGCVTTREVEAAVLSAVSGLPAGDMVRLRLTGHCTVETQKDLPYLTGVLQRWFYFAEVKDETRLAIDPAEYKNDISLKGEFVRVVLASRMPQEEKDRVLACGLRALLGEELPI